MLSSVVMYLTPEDTCSLNPSVGRSIHGFLLRVLQEGDENLAEKYHKKLPIKPFTVSPIYGSFGRTSTQKLIVKDFEYWIRFTFLQEEGLKIFSKVIFPMSIERGQVFLNGEPFRISNVVLEPSSKNRWSGLARYEDILEEGQKLAEKKDGFLLSLRFYSPTTFRKGDTSYIIPEPSLVFGSYLKKWNTFSGNPLPKNLGNSLSQRVVLSGYRLQTEMYDTGNVALPGFKGRCWFSLLDSSKELFSHLITLGLFSFYAGTGQKTTMGMGQTKLVHIS